MHKLAKKPKQFLPIAGLTVPQFDSPYKETKNNCKTAEQKGLSKNRERGIGAGHKFDLSFKGRILMFFMYYRMYATYDMPGMTFDLDRPNVMRNIGCLEPAVKQSI